MLRSAFKVAEYLVLAGAMIAWPDLMPWGVCVWLGLLLLGD